MRCIGAVQKRFHICFRLERTFGTRSHNSMAGWPNGKALDYESRDCRFDPCVGHYFFLLLETIYHILVFAPWQGNHTCVVQFFFDHG
ncbi:hypothetical protein ACN38_g612 [Penicillium nordicum]|uniref:Uncharacterized protein n=1 Tax=Penicillium nordicum TaxID=229535 RepID=A0A0M8PGY5_9EURO|nr:hypothetical protein ACN38_g612 [Penicillium nordicum]